MFKSATLKLTLWYVVIAMSLSLIFSGVLYHFSTNELSEGLSDQYHRIVNNDHDTDNFRSVNLTELNTRSRHLVANLIYFNVVVLIGTCALSYLLARRTLRPIEEAHKAQVRFTAEASHELRTPLAAIKADTEAVLMNKKASSSLLHRTLQDNLADIDKLEKLANHLIEISRQGSKTIKTDQTLELESVTKDVAATFKRRTSDKKIKLTLKTIPVKIKGESQAIKQLLTIILDNAIKYSNENGIIIVNLTNTNKWARIIVEDKGIGVPEEDLPHIFDWFYRSKNVDKTKDHVDGYGLGLPLAKDIIDLHHGSINVISMEGIGTKVTILLPRAKD